MIKHFNIKDNYLRKQFNKKESDLRTLLSLRQNRQLALTRQSIQLVSQQKLADLYKFSYPVRVKNRCIQTGRSGSIYKWCRLSRHQRKKLASRGQLAGVRKFGW